jgi:predicted acetyltransferase
LDENSELDGGNLEVAVPPSCRREGNGAYALSLLLFEAVRAGLSRALCTCPAADQAARRMIERNRGKLLDEVKSPGRPLAIARYWISFRGQ